jgi:glycosyltransferase involved in cell wall biosynthesis
VTHTLHVVALPHTTLTEKDASCAYSQKVRKFVTMMRAEGHRVLLYGPDEIDCQPDEHIVIASADDRERWGFGNDGFDTVRGDLRWDRNEPYWLETNVRAADAIRDRLAERDYLCLVTSCQDPIVSALGGWTNPITVEWAVGYEGVCGPFAAYESYAWMHHVYGLRERRNSDGHQFDTVIPNFFDPAEFPDPPARRPGDYLLFIGRFIESKGVLVAEHLARRAGRQLVIAGPGVTHSAEGLVEAPGLRLEGNVSYAGQVGYAERATLMTNAYAVLVPTLYIEPFGGVAVEAMMCGTPVVASDWGAFTETVTPAVGRRIRTHRDGDRALAEVEHLDRPASRRAALERYSLEAIGPRFTAWFDSLATLWGKGYDT